MYMFYLQKGTFLSVSRAKVIVFDQITNKKYYFSVKWWHLDEKALGTCTHACHIVHI